MRWADMEWSFLSIAANFVLQFVTSIVPVSSG